MKHGKRPTVAQKKLMQQWGLASADWLVVKDTSEEMVVVNRWSDKTTKTIIKRMPL